MSACRQRLAPKKPWRASSSRVLAGDDRVVKASPTGGLRPALTTLAFPATSAATVTPR